MSSDFVCPVCKEIRHALYNCSSIICCGTTSSNKLLPPQTAGAGTSNDYALVYNFSGLTVSLFYGDQELALAPNEAAQWPLGKLPNQRG